MAFPVTSAEPPTHHHGKRWLRARLLKLTRALHIYLAMLGLALMSFFAITGFLLNHNEWFDRGQPTTRTATGQLSPALLAVVDKLAVAERLRADFGITGFVAEFAVEDDVLRVTWKSPGRRTDATVTRANGAVEVTYESRGLIGRLTDLHRGADAGQAWQRVIDAVAVLLLFAAASGAVLWWHLPKRRKLGAAALLLGLAASLGVYLFFVA